MRGTIKLLQEAVSFWNLGMSKNLHTIYFDKLSINYFGPFYIIVPFDLGNVCSKTHKTCLFVDLFFYNILFDTFAIYNYE